MSDLLAAPAQEPESVSGSGAFKIALGAFIVFVVSVAVAAWLLRASTPRRTAEHGRTAIIPPKVNGRIEATLIETTASGWARRAEQRRVLESYAWVDRNRAVAHIPIERAMAELAHREKRP